MPVTKPNKIETPWSVYDRSKAKRSTRSLIEEAFEEEEREEQDEDTEE